MTTYLPAAPTRGEPERHARSGRALHPFALAVGAIAAVQAIVIGSLATSGAFYLDDVDMTAEAAKYPFGWHYLTLALNDHLTPGLRAFYWLSAHYAPYGNGVTVLVRVLVQVLATALMGYLLAQLFGPGRTALLGLGLYAFSPLIVPSLLSLSSGVNLLPTHVGVLILLVMHVRCQSTGKLKYAVYGALGGLLALLFWEKAVLSFALAPLLTLLYLSNGGLRARLRTLWQLWPAWLAYATPVLAFFAYFLLGPYGSHGTSPHLGDVWSIAWDAWLHSLSPAMIGGPWHWFTTNIVYYSASAPSSIGSTCGQFAAIIITALGMRRNGLWAIRAWVLPVFVLFGTAILLAAGRFEYVGEILARNFHYFSELSIPMVLAVMLLLVRVEPVAVAARGRAGLWLDGGSYVVARPSAPEAAPAPDETLPEQEPERRDVTKSIGIGLVILIAAYALSYGTTVRAFERRWVENPIGDYLTNAVTDLKLDTAKGPVAVYDNDVPGTVATLLQNNRRVSDVFRPVEPELSHAIRWDDAGRQLYMFDQGGHLLKARFVEEAASADQPGVFCSHPLRGVGSVTVTLSTRITRPDAFVQLEYLAQTSSSVTITLADGTRTFAPRRNGTPTLGAGKYSTVLLGTPDRAFDRVVITSTDPSAGICFSAKAGHPEAAL